ncbi:MAG: hypothetical protein KC502_02080 [Myxococcales bacterium]|nr:hypothetical protein [Myxococcales bacterium]
MTIGSGACNRPVSEPAAHKTAVGPAADQAATAPKAPGQSAAKVNLGTVDDTPIPLAWMQARLRQSEPDLSKDEAVAIALLAAAADIICLREFKVLGLEANPGESPQGAVDRLLAGTWPATPACRVDPADLKLAYLGQPGKWRHPTSLTLWEVQLACCDDCDTRQTCEAGLADAAKLLHSRLKKALPPPLAVTQAALADSPAVAAHVPAFERTVASASGPIKPKMMRYTAFARELAFRKLAFRRADPRVEQATLPLPIGGLTEPIPTGTGWTIAMVVGHEPPLAGGLSSPKTRRALRAHVCAEQAVGQRAAYRERMLSKSILKWDKAEIARLFGDGVVALLPTPRRRPRPVVPH